MSLLCQSKWSQRTAKIDIHSNNEPSDKSVFIVDVEDNKGRFDSVCVPVVKLGNKYYT